MVSILCGAISRASSHIQPCRHEAATHRCWLNRAPPRPRASPLWRQVRGYQHPPVCAAEHVLLDEAVPGRWNARDSHFMAAVLRTRPPAVPVARLVPRRMRGHRQKLGPLLVLQNGFRTRVGLQVYPRNDPYGVRFAAHGTRLTFQPVIASGISTDHCRLALPGDSWCNRCIHSAPFG